jgi:hypothetical protein
LRALAANLELVRELHDQLGQTLTAMKFDLAWLTDRLVDKDVALGQRAKTVTAQMDTMIKTVRRIACSCWCWRYPDWRRYLTQTRPCPFQRASQHRDLRRSARRAGLAGAENVICTRPPHLRGELNTCVRMKCWQ